MKKANFTKNALRLMVLAAALFTWQFAGAQTFTGAGNPQPIPVTGTGGFPCTGGPVTSVADASSLTGNIGTAFAIENVTLNITHTWASDLDIQLISPDGTAWELTSDNGGSGDNYTNTMFVDGAPSITTGAAPFTGTFQAEQGPFATGFDGDNAGGLWTLSICDDAGGDVGTLNSWSITFESLMSNCTIECPANVTVSNDPGECGAFVDLPLPTLSPGCDLNSVTNNITGTGAAAAFYPVGTTVVEYCATDDAGAQACCELEVTVTDDEAPTFDPCPSDIVLTLDPGACGAFINYTVAAFDNCPAVASTVAGPLCDPCVDPSGGSALACAPFAQNSIIQFVELPGNGTIDFFCFNQETFGNAPLATINIYGPQATPPSTQGGDTPIGSQMYQTNAADDGSCVCVDFDTPVVIPAGANGVWVEVFTPGVTLNSRVVQTPASCDGNNATGQNTWIEAPACGLTPPGTFASLGFVLDASFALGYNPGEIEVIQTDNSGFTAGDEFPIGTTIQTWEATDLAGNTSTCEFSIQINEFPNPTPSLACNDNVQISLDETGCATVGADDILEGGPYGCYDDYIVEVLNQFGFPNGDVVCCDLVGQTRTVRVTDPETGNMCWGSIVIEDKLPPVLECEDFSVNCNTSLEEILFGAENVGTLELESGSIPSFDNATENVEFDVSVGVAQVTDVNVSLDISHTWVSDLDVSLVAPDGTTINLFNDQCGTADDVDVTMDDDGAPFACSPGAPAITGTLQPFGTLADANGLDVNGTWTVVVTDDLGGDPAIINNIILEISYEGVTPSLFVDDNCTDYFQGVPSPYSLDDLDLDPNISWETIEQPGDCNGDAAVYTIFYSVVDESGNESTCTQTITVIRPTLADVELPPMYDDIDQPVLDCSGNGWDTNGNGYPDPEETGFPTIGGDIFENNDLCNLTWTFEDVELPICDGSYKIRREWLIIDWCTGDEAEYNQLITVMDMTGPDVVCPQGPVTINVYQASAPSGGVHEICEGFVNIPPIQVLGDDCSNLDPGSYVTEVWSNVNGAPGVVLETAAGNGGTFVLDIIADNPPTNQAEYFVRHRIYDSCGNVTDCLYLITLVDKVPPVAICDEITELSITNNGGSGEGCSTLPAENLDDGSYDNCGDVYFYAAKMNAFLTPPYFYQYYPSLEFCCDEIGDNMVILLVLDFDPTLTPGATLPDGSIFLLPGNQIFEGSFNTCMVTVQVTDKIPPVLLSCPQSATITCDEYLDTYAAPLEQDDFSILDVFGEAVFYDNCDLEIDTNVTVNIDACSEGTITRSWTANDAAGNGPVTCTQTITVFHVSDWVVEFPADITAECVDGSLPDFGEPEVFFDECELIGTSFEDVYFYIVPDACYKIERYWTVINWCVYDDFGTDVYEEDGFAECNLFVDWDGDGDQRLPHLPRWLEPERYSWYA
jgi:subtilisin-like proprotein convertase family protein